MINSCIFLVYGAFFDIDYSLFLITEIFLFERICMRRYVAVNLWDVFNPRLSGFQVYHYRFFLLRAPLHPNHWKFIALVILIYFFVKRLKSNVMPK